MPKTRRLVANAVAEKFLPTKMQVTSAAAASYECLALMLIARDEAKMGPEFAAEILAATREAADAAFIAQDRMHRVHALLAPIRAAWQIPPGAYGPNDTASPQAPAQPMISLTIAA